MPVSRASRGIQRLQYGVHTAPFAVGHSASVLGLSIRPANVLARIVCVYSLRVIRFILAILSVLSIPLLCAFLSVPHTETSPAFLLLPAPLSVAKVDHENFSANTLYGWQ